MVITDHFNIGITRDRIEYVRVCRADDTETVTDSFLLEETSD